MSVRCKASFFALCKEGGGARARRSDESNESSAPDVTCPNTAFFNGDTMRTQIMVSRGGLMCFNVMHPSVHDPHRTQGNKHHMTVSHTHGILCTSPMPIVPRSRHHLRHQSESSRLCTLSCLTSHTGHHFKQQHAHTQTSEDTLLHHAAPQQGRQQKPAGHQTSKQIQRIIKAPIIKARPQNTSHSPIQNVNSTQ